MDPQWIKSIQAELDHINMLQKQLLQKFPESRGKIESRCLFYRQMLSIIRTGLEQNPEKYIEDLQTTAIMHRASQYCEFVLSLCDR